MTTHEIDTIVDGLSDAIRICADVDGMSEDYEKSYPYAAGYARASMQHAVQTLLQLKERDYA